MDAWTTKRILILGTTYPAYSKKYTENACTGGITEDTKEMVRIHPVPLRYLEEKNRFRKFQWITAKVQQHSSDPRPESLRVEPDSIVAGEIMAPKDEARRRFIEESPHFMSSVEELKERWQRDGTSLGTIQPKEILGVRVARKGAKERDDWRKKEDELFAQQRFEFERPPKKLDFPELNFLVKWACDDKRCNKPHEMGILQWGLHELARKLHDDPQRDDKLVQAMKKELDLDKRDVFLFLGNYRSKMFNFGLMDSYSPTRQAQLKLF